MNHEFMKKIYLQLLLICFCVVYGATQKMDLGHYLSTQMETNSFYIKRFIVPTPGDTHRLFCSEDLGLLSMGDGSVLVEGSASGSAEDSGSGSEAVSGSGSEA